MSGPAIYRAALAIETLANLSSLPTIFLYPGIAASYLLKGPAQSTPATRSLIQWFGGMILGITVPLLLSYPTPGLGKAGEQQIAIRRLTYIVLGACEIGLISVMTVQFAAGDSGFTDQALLGGMGSMGAFVAMRAYFMLVKPEWMAEERSAGKTR